MAATFDYKTDSDIHKQITRNTTYVLMHVNIRGPPKFLVYPQGGNTHPTPTLKANIIWDKQLWVTAL